MYPIKHHHKTLQSPCNFRYLAKITNLLRSGLHSYLDSGFIAFWAKYPTCVSHWSSIAFSGSVWIHTTWGVQLSIIINIYLLCIWVDPRYWTRWKELGANAAYWKWPISSIIALSISLSNLRIFYSFRASGQGPWKCLWFFFFPFIDRQLYFITRKWFRFVFSPISFKEDMHVW